MSEQMRLNVRANAVTRFWTSYTPECRSLVYITLRKTTCQNRKSRDKKLLFYMVGFNNCPNKSKNFKVSRMLQIFHMHRNFQIFPRPTPTQYTIPSRFKKLLSFDERKYSKNHNKKSRLQVRLLN